MTLGEKQRHIAKALVIVEQYIFFLGYEIAMEDSYRNPKVHGEFGVKKSYAAASSVHKLKLGRDYSIFRDGQYVTGSEARDVFNKAHDLADMLGLAKRIKGDLGHFSMEHQGHR